MHSWSNDPSTKQSLFNNRFVSYTIPYFSFTYLMYSVYICVGESSQNKGKILHMKVCLHFWLVHKRRPWLNRNVAGVQRNTRWRWKTSVLLRSCGEWKRCTPWGQQHIGEPRAADLNPVWEPECRWFLPCSKPSQPRLTLDSAVDGSRRDSRLRSLEVK